MSTFKYTAGVNLYAKPEPSIEPWGSDVVVGIEGVIAGATRNTYVFNLTSSASYTIYLRAGAEPAPSDEDVGVFPPKPVNIVVAPVSTNQEQRNIQNIRRVFWKEIVTHNINVRTEDGKFPVDLSGLTLKAVIQTNDTSPVNVESLPVTVSGSGNNIVEFTTTQLTSNRVGETLIWALRDSTDPFTVILEGQIVVLRAAFIPE